MLSATGPSQYFTLDSACWYGCKETGAGNCEEICQVPAYSVTGTAAGTGTPPPTQKPLIAGVKNEYLLIAAAILGVVLISR